MKSNQLIKLSDKVSKNPEVDKLEQYINWFMRNNIDNKKILRLTLSIALKVGLTADDIEDIIRNDF